MTSVVKGYSNAIVSAATFGMIPLFTLPLLSAGITMPSILFYRFGVGSLAMLLVLLVNRKDMRISLEQLWRIALLAFLYDLSAVALIMGYNYLPSGIATTLLFSYPIWTSLIMTVFFHERLSLPTVFAILIAVGGVACLSGMTHGFKLNSLIGLALEIVAGLTYSIYMVLVKVMKVRTMGSLKLTFYVFSTGMLFLLLYALCVEGGVSPVVTWHEAFNLLVLALLPTALSNVSLIMAIKQIGSTLTAVLGAFEPVTAMLVGILVFGEPLTAPVVLGFCLIILSVFILVLQNGHTNGVGQKH